MKYRLANAAAGRSKIVVIHQRRAADQSAGCRRSPRRLDDALRLFVVTPDMHRVHHSIEPRDTNSNFGFNLPWWDYLLGTCRSQPAAGHEKMVIALEQVRDEREQWLHWILQPEEYAASAAWA